MVYDCIIIGGGPAGLSAAIYLGRFLRKTLVLDNGDGRSSFSQINDNYLGFPDGVAVRELRDLGREQARRFGVEFKECTAESLERRGEDFVVICGDETMHAKSIIFCTGVRDIWPELPNVLDYVGKDLFWCITCDGFRAINKKTLLFGCDDDAATTACQFKHYTDNIVFITEPGNMSCSQTKVADMSGHGIKTIQDKPVGFIGEPGAMKGVRLAKGEIVEGEIAFSLLGCNPRNQLARDIGVQCTPAGYIKVDEDGQTSVPGFFCAGDISKMHSHQVVSAAHEGAEAAQSANYYLYAGYQKLPADAEADSA